MENDPVLEKIRRENEQLVKYNQDLMNQIKLLNSKLSLFRRVGPEIGVSFNDSSTQTDECVPKNSFPSGSKTGINEEGDWKGCRSNGIKKVSDMVREVAEKVTGSDDYIWLEHELRFYCKSSGWYYYPSNQLFLDPRSNKYFKFNPLTNKHEYHSKASSMKNSRPRKSLEPKNTDKNNPLEDDDEEGEIVSSDEEDLVCLDSDDDPPIKSAEEVSAARLIVKKSRSLELGSLILVPPIPSFIIGLDRSSDLLLTNEDLNCDMDCSGDHSQDYLIITYSEESGLYEMHPSKDGNNLFKCLQVSHAADENGTVSLNHGSVFSLGCSNEYLIHVHDGKDVTCTQCEPGCVQADLKDRESSFLTSSSSTSTTSVGTHRQRLKDLKRKYGLERDSFESPSVNISPSFKDRSKERRIKKGSTNPYEKTASSSLDQHIPRVNKGFKLLEKMGWKHGSTLGSRTSSATDNSTALLEPICPELKSDRSGFGTS